MNFVGGSLKLKGLTKPVTQISSKSKDIKKDKKDKKKREKVPENSIVLKEDKKEEKISKKEITVPSKPETPKSVEEYLTPAQKQFREIQMLRLKQKVQAGDGELMTGHRQKVENFNKKLANLPEHNDIPKVGPG